MKRIFVQILFLFLLFSMQLSAQTTEGSSSYSALALYLNSPTGDFADAAKFGGGLGFEGAYYFLPMLGIAYGLDVQVNPFNEDDIPDAFQDQIDTQPWAYGNLMTGLELSYPLTSKLAPELRLMGGLMVMRFPEVTIDAIVADFTQEAQIKPAFTYGVSGGLKYLMDDARALRAGVRYLSGSPKYETDGISETVDINSFQVYLSFAF